MTPKDRIERLADRCRREREARNWMQAQLIALVRDGQHITEEAIICVAAEAAKVAAGRAPLEGK